MVSMYMPHGVLLQKNSRNHQNGDYSNNNSSSTENDLSDNFTWIFGGLLAFTVVVSLVVWYLRRRLDEEERRHAEYEQQRQQQQYEQNMEIGSEDEGRFDGRLYVTDEHRRDYHHDSNGYPEFKSRLYEVDRHSSDIDYKDPPTTDSIFTYSNTVDYGLRNTAIGCASAPSENDRRSRYDDRSGEEHCFENSYHSSNYLSIPSRCQVAPERTM